MLYMKKKFRIGMEKECNKLN